MSAYASRRRLCLPLAVLIAVGIHGAAASVSAEPATFQSRFYQITTTLDEEMAAQVAEHADLMHAQFARQFANFGGRALQHHPLFVFATQQEYQQLLAEHGIDGRGSSGMFFISPQGSGLATFLEGQGLTGMLRTLRHEGFHQFAHSKIGRDLPQWANEGLAEYFAEAIVLPDRLAPGQIAPASLHNVQTAIENDSYVPFQRLLNLSNQEWNDHVRRGDSRLMYDQAWSIVHFLVHADDRLQVAFDDFLIDIGRGMGADRAFDRAFGAPLNAAAAAFEQEWMQYVQQLEPTPATIAEQRLTFLGEGLGMLHEREVQVESIDELREVLREIQFRMQMTLGHGLTLDMRADEDENFQPPEIEGRGRPPELELVPSEDDALPPGLVITGLQHTVHLQWRDGPEGQPVSEIRFR